MARSTSKLNKFGGGAVKSPFPIKRAEATGDSTAALQDTNFLVDPASSVPLAQGQSIGPDEGAPEPLETLAGPPDRLTPNVEEDLLAPTAPTPPPFSFQQHALAARATYSYRVKLQGFVAEMYQKAAQTANVDIEEVMEQRLRQCASHTDAKALYFTEHELRELERLLNTNFTDPATDAQKALNRVRGLTSVAVDELDFANLLTPVDVERLRSRAEAYKKTFHEYLADAIIFGVKSQTGQI